MRQLSSIIGVAALVLVSACGSDGPAAPAKPNNGTMSAQIDGAAWSAISIATESAPASSLVITGTNVTQMLALVIPLDPGVGTQTIGSTTPVAGLLGIGSQSWAASRAQGGAGRITLTTVAPGHIAGTFEFTMAGSQGASPATRQVTSGQFDVRY